MTPEQAAALERAVAVTGHARFRQLLDPGHRDYQPAYWAVVSALAGVTPPPGVAPGPPPPPDPAPNPHQERLLLVYGCDYRGEPIGCGCNATRHCALGRGPLRSSPFEVALRDCLGCVTAP